ncbi:MAG: FkbM family methyltransferase, partial [Rhodothermales bacterium]|nr:FkbM family methyltransferase [Rhodothermales bacterium]
GPAPDEEVEVTTIDALLAEAAAERVDLLKLDIEGSEFDVFTADTRWLGSVAVLVIELHDRFRPGCTEALMEALSAWDFDHDHRTYNHVFVNRRAMAASPTG